MNGGLRLFALSCEHRTLSVDAVRLGDNYWCDQCQRLALVQTEVQPRARARESVTGWGDRHPAMFQPGESLGAWLHDPQPPSRWCRLYNWLRRVRS